MKKSNIFRLIAGLLIVAMLASISVFPLAADENPADGAVTESQTEQTEEPADSETPADTEEPADSEEPVDSETPADTEEPADDSSEEEEEEEEEEVEYLTDEQALARSTLIAENDTLELYLDEEYERVGLYVKESGFVHWTNCVNALLDDATSKPPTLKTRLSNLAVRYGNATDRTQNAASYNYSYRESTEQGTTTYELEENGVKITYYFSSVHAYVPLHLTLCDGYLEATIYTDEIDEVDGYVEGVNAEESDTDVIILTEISMLPFMSAAGGDETGYMIIPDGSGAVINLNNGKTNYANYSSTLYGNDVTRVRELKADETEQATLPVLAMVRGNNGLVMVATDGDEFATVNAAVAYNTSEQGGYNHCYFSFILRSTDEYNMAGQSNILVFERGDGSVPVDKLSVRYYPVTSENEVVDYTEVAEVYRNYLIEEEGLTNTTKSDYAPLFVDFYGGTLKSKSILGIPIDIKTAFTTFEQAVEITTELMDLGVTDMVINYNDWSSDSMSGKIDTGDSVAACLGGKGDYEDMIEFFNENGLEYYGSLDSYTFTSNGNGFLTLFDTAYRISKSYARPYEYNIAYGTPEPGVAPALLAPKSIPDLAEKVAKNLSKFEGAGAGLGSFSTKLWSDYSTKNATNRTVTAQYIKDFYQLVKDSTGSIIADAPNAYVIPYADRIKNVPLDSSQFKITDLDIPFVQMVLHGYVPYSTEAINSLAESKEMFLKAIAAGSNIQYDFIYSSATELNNTDYVGLYYATYEGWLDECIGEYKLAKEVLAPVSDALMVGYEVDGSVITTTYDNGYVTTVNLETGEITADGNTYNYSDYVDEGGLV